MSERPTDRDTNTPLRNVGSAIRDYLTPPASSLPSRVSLLPGDDLYFGTDLGESKSEEEDSAPGSGVEESKQEDLLAETLTEFSAPIAEESADSSSHSSPATTTSSSTTTTTMANVTLGDFQVTKVAKNTNVNHGALHKKATRGKLNASDLTTLFVTATKPFKNGLRFRALPMEMTDPKQLSEFHNVDSVVRAFESNAKLFDYADVFNIVFPIQGSTTGDLEEEVDENGTTITKTRDLFRFYTQLTPSEVAKSCQWYHEYTDDGQDRLHENLMWSFHSLENNTDPSFFHALNQIYQKYDEVQRGGPLLFVLVMNELLFTNESSISALAKQIKDYKINKIPGENIKNIASIMLSVSRRIWYSKKKKFPERYVEELLNALQTTSVPPFNAQFDTFARQRTSEQAASTVLRLDPNSPGLGKMTTQTIDDSLTTVEFLLNVARQLYDRYVQDGIWSKHVKSGTSSRALVNQDADVVCWNCGAKHHLDDCPKPRDDAKIEKSKVDYKKKKAAAKKAKSAGNSTSNNTNNTNNGAGQTQTSGGGRANNSGRGGFVPIDKFRPPEANENGKRFIFTRAAGNRSYTWNPTTNRWVMDSTPAAATTQTAGSHTTVNTDAPSNIATMSEAEKRALAANLKLRLEQVNEYL